MQRWPWNRTSTSSLRTISTSLIGSSLAAAEGASIIRRTRRSAPMRLRPSHALCYLPTSLRRDAPKTMSVADQLEVYTELDRRLVAATRGIRLLQAVSWPASIEMEFVAAWKKGTATLPVIEYPRVD